MWNRWHYTDVIMNHVNSLSYLVSTLNTNKTKPSSLHNPWNRSVHFFVVLSIMSWFNGKIIINNRHDKSSILDRYFDNDCCQQNVIDVVRAGTDT